MLDGVFTFLDYISLENSYLYF